MNVVRRPEQAEALRAQGAKFVCDSSAPTFVDDLTEALAATGATIAFDAVGGGRLAGQLLSAMEAAINRKVTDYNRYGSSVHKQVYVYGTLDRAPTEIKRDFGMAWSIGGWLLFPFLTKAGEEVAARMRARVVAEIRTTFASHYTKEISLAQAVRWRRSSSTVRRPPAPRCSSTRPCKAQLSAGGGSVRRTGPRWRPCVRARRRRSARSGPGRRFPTGG